MLTLDQYRALVSLDQPFTPPAPAGADERPALVAMLNHHLAAETPGDAAASGVSEGKSEDTSEDARILLRVLLTVRAPLPLSQHIHGALDRLLQAEARERPRVEPAGLPALFDPAHAGGARCVLWQGDITALAADAIVNAANAKLLGCFHPFHPCIDNAIHAAAGPRLREDCARIMHAQGAPEPTGHAKATRGYNLPARFVLHTVGPIVHGRTPSAHDDEALSRCYRACLETAAQLPGVRTLALCGISTGVFGFPRQPAARIALRTVGAWLRAHPGRFEVVVFNVFTDADQAAYQKALAAQGGAP